ncbi:glutathione S-transferase family protein [Undibacterium sp. Jales W-56]|uniref:glutathione S-transferase family protein n=1 Tax=Undibacterium sp. Jales W-56 TaxID=2897325 RepID=UPI0021D08872|nr:glutathione S-transferase family protein [Undibacterium sp. Jales W-56]MCU6433432.1 glutathione S-transferase family protein [Undibacterium sp. Jales W-56]
MSEIIFHHYPVSPFSEKIRLIFGFKNLAWKSVMIPAIMPKPDVTALTGGYRRTPVMQIGADIYCDTALIADVLERIAPTPGLYPPAIAGLSKTLAQWADTSLFWTAIAYTFQPAAMTGILGDITPEQMKAFGADRAAMRAGAPRMSLPEATGQLLEYLRRIENMLSHGSTFLLGADASIADFSVYHALWFIRRVPAVAGILDAYPLTLAWMDQVAAFGHGRPDKMRSDEALAVANSAAPAQINASFVDTHGIALGDTVAVMPTDYALDPVIGELVCANEHEFAVKRTDERAGTVVVHFPRIGFQMKRVD